MKGLTVLKTNKDPAKLLKILSLFHLVGLEEIWFKPTKSDYLSKMSLKARTYLALRSMK